MTPPASFVSESLDAEHGFSHFDSGRPPLDTWLRKSARHAEAMRTARTFVWHAGDRMVVAYFSLAAHLVRREDVPRTVGRGSPDAIPSILLARLALHRELQGQGLGGELLWDTLSRAVAAGELVGARLVVVDAIDADAAGFYAHHGFTPVPGNPNRLVQRVGDIAAALGI